MMDVMFDWYVMFIGWLAVDAQFFFTDLTDVSGDPSGDDDDE